MYNNNENRFQQAPTVEAPRSTFTMHQNIRTTFNAGLLIPFFVDSDIMPGDTFKVKGTFVIRQSTPIYPTMDNSFLDVYFFFIPHRLVWDHWKEFWGENTTGAWTQTTTYTIPQIRISNNLALAGGTQIKKGDSLQYMGIPMDIPVTTNGITISALPWRALALTWNEWFRDENMCPPLRLYKGDAEQQFARTSLVNNWGIYASTENTSKQIFGACPPVYKFKDYFNACLPEPQKGTPITLPIGASAPIVADIVNIANPTTSDLQNFKIYNGNASIINYNAQLNVDNNGSMFTSDAGVGQGTEGVYHAIGLNTGAYADLSNAVAATINAQRFAFAAQRILEARARCGTRYVEVISSIFGVKDPSSARQQRPEYLGGKRIPITMNQVAQTSSTDSTSPQGNVSAYSHTVDSDHFFSKSFTEHGTLLGLLCVRQEHSYDTGIARMWSRKEVLDFYQPQMAFLGEQAILNKEIYVDGSSTDEQVFGYNERWAELRYKANINTGAFSTKYAQSLDSWHYGDAYSSLPVLSDAWRRETKDFIDRTLAVQSSVEDQYLMDSRLDFVATRCVPCYSIPGLQDHF